MFYRYFSLLVIAVLLLSSCEYQPFPGTPYSEFSALKDDVFLLREEMEELSFNLKRQQSKFEEFMATTDSELEDILGKLLEAQVDIIVNKKVTKVTINAKQDDGFQSLDSQAGKFLVSVKDVQPHLDGYKVTFTIGNPTSATFSNPTIYLRWNTPLKMDWKASKIQREKQRESWEKSFKEKEFNLLRDFDEGSWSRVELFLTPCSAKELECIEFSIKTPTLSLHVDK